MGRRSPFNLRTMCGNSGKRPVGLVLVVPNASLHKILQQGRALRPWSMSRWLEGRHPDPLRVGYFTAGPGETFTFLCPRAPVPPPLEPESRPPRWSRDFWDTTLGDQGMTGF